MLEVSLLIKGARTRDENGVVVGIDKKYEIDNGQLKWYMR